MVSTIGVTENDDSEACDNIFQTGHPMIISIIRQARNTYYEASDNVLQIGHLLGSNAVQREFHTNNSKVSRRR